MSDLHVSITNKNLLEAKLVKFTCPIPIISIQTSIKKTKDIQRFSKNNNHPWERADQAEIQWACVRDQLYC